MFYIHINVLVIIVYDANGGTGVTASSSHTYGETKALAVNGFAKDRYTFGGWNTEADGSGMGYMECELINLVTSDGEVVTLYAQWLDGEYNVHFNANGGSGTMISQKHKYDVSLALQTNGFTKTGYSFTAWNTEADGSGISYTNEQVVINLVNEDENVGSITLYAQWTPNVYNVVYDANGGSGSMQNSEHTYDVGKELNANSFYKEYSRFMGWNTKADGTGTFYADNETVTNLSAVAGDTVILYAVWKNYTVYNSVSDTTNISDENVVINWSQVTDTDIAAARGDGTLSVPNTVKELTLIGNPNATYTNFSILLVDFAKNQELKLHLIDFNYISNVDGAIKPNGTDNGMILTVEVSGSCSIGTSVPSGNIITGFTNMLNFVGDGEITITAGNGSNGSNGANGGQNQDGGAGSVGENGGIAISCKSLYVEGLKLTAIGGNGGNGGNGGWGNSAWYVSANRSGGAGGNGGVGGIAISVNDVTLSNVAAVTVVGGNGGNGGNGGKSGDDGRSGKGGDAGNGGSGIVAYNVTKDASDITVLGGTAGSAGQAGDIAGNGSSGGSGSSASDGEAIVIK